jgi:MraZ protein
MRHPWDDVMLTGQYTLRLDDKNRLTVPARLRDRFADGIVVTKGLDNCLTAFTPEGWEAFREVKLGRLDPFEREARMLRRFYFGATLESQLDGNGRVPLPAPLLTFAGIERDIELIGNYDYLEIWCSRRFQDIDRQSHGSAEDAAERVARESKG